ncbi:Na+/H+ antiporter subunit E [Clostridium sp. MD294]|uniref:Na+/H+ antiporter subunit E n=1 Tax=Clostridium sp. MD294 TaxID=97138 RepID=UPI0002C961F2|nr:Na+/H+ antiporter subunit E [Clostridium sp. MD294]NDO46873.1 sodium:proton antiporter [Clostridium sp. MD294]USF28684.1 Na(+)/H(+) antiporter subunit E1 [Clostridium sp. MD294]
MLFIVMYLLWFLFNGRVTIELAIIGLLICGALYYFTQKFIREEKRQSILSGHIFDFTKYAFVLFIEIIKSNIAVMKLILNPNMKQWHPSFVTFTSELEDERMRVLLANSITLTPGTITVGMEEKEFTVHVLDSRGEEQIEHGVFAQKLFEIERREKNDRK